MSLDDESIPLSQSQGISYEITHNHLSRFLWVHDLHDDTIKRLQHYCHLVQLLPRIQVQVTLHQRYIKVHVEGLISGVRMLLHQLSHHHYILHYKSWPPHPCTPWRSIIPLEELKSSAEGHVPCFWRNSRQLSELWFVNWSSSMALITPMRSHSNNMLCALWGIGCLRATFSEYFGHHLDPNLTYAITITTASQIALQVAITHHGIVPNNLNSIPTLVNFSPHQFIAATTNIPPTIDALALLIQWGNFFDFLSWNFRLKVIKKICSLPPFLGKRMKPSRCFTWGFLDLKRIFRAS